MSFACPESLNRNAAPFRHLTVLEQYGYSMGKPISSGSYSAVFEIILVRNNTKLAVKIIFKKKATEQYLSNLFHREVQVMKSLQHQNVLIFHKAIETTKRVYLVLELAQGGSVMERINESGPCQEPQAGKWFSQVCLAMGYIHGKGIVHRNLKIDNLLLDINDNIKITDFGFCKVAFIPGRQCVLSQTYCGSYAYASPEILMGTPYCPFLSDVWSMGVILYVFLTAHLPFDDSNLRTLLKDIRQQVNFPSKEHISQACKALVLKMLRPPTHRASVLDILQSPWILHYLPEPPHAELKALEAIAAAKHCVACSVK